VITEDIIESNFMKLLFIAFISMSSLVLAAGEKEGTLIGSPQDTPYDVTIENSSQDITKDTPIAIESVPSDIEVYSEDQDVDTTEDESSAEELEVDDFLFTSFSSLDAIKSAPENTSQTTEKVGHNVSLLDTSAQVSQIQEMMALESGIGEESGTEGQEGRLVSKVSKKRKHNKSSEINGYTCDVCSKLLATDKSLKQHKIIHTGEKPYKCDLCDYASNRRYHIVTHKRIHTGEKPYQCDQCDKAFAQSNGLTQHKRIHTGEKPYKCDYPECTYASISSGTLKQHKCTHTREKSYKCDLCDYSTAYSRDLKVHKRSHTGEKPYTCDLCMKAFATSSSLKNHLHTHTKEKQYKCKQCDYICGDSNSLKIHKRKHIDEKSYKCDQCNYSTGYSSALKVHKRTHTGEKPCQCDQCDKAFVQAGDLKRHKLIHVEEKLYGRNFYEYSADAIRRWYLHKSKKQRTNMMIDSQLLDQSSELSKDKSQEDLAVHNTTIDLSSNAMPSSLFPLATVFLFSANRGYGLVPENQEDSEQNKVRFEEEMYKCEYCSYSNPRKEVVNMHMIIHKLDLLP
jgi:uncharacterized Zn-finger protein